MIPFCLKQPNKLFFLFHRRRLGR